jgi:anti-sigma factor RsiW
MRPCECDKELLVAHALGETDPAEVAALEARLRDCPDCREEFSLHRQLADDLAGRPPAPMPADLREILIRSAIQVRRDSSPAWASSRSSGRGRIAWTPILCAGAGLAIVGLLVLLVLPGGGPGGSVDEVVVGGVGRGATAVEEILQLVSNLQSGWNLASDFLQRFAPLARAVQTAFSAVGLLRWAVTFLSVLGVIGLLWRLNRSSQNRSVRHA